MDDLERVHLDFHFKRALKEELDDYKNRDKLWGCTDEKLPAIRGNLIDGFRDENIATWEAAASE